MNSLVRWACLIAALLSLLFFGDVALGAWSKREWWSLIAALASCFALIVFLVAVSLGVADFGKTAYSIIAGVAVVCGMFSLGSDVSKFQISAGTQTDIQDLFVKIEAGQVITSSDKAMEIAKVGQKQCVVQRQIDSIALLGRSWETLNIGPAMTMFFGVAFKKPKRNPSCLELYGELLRLEPMANKGMDLKTVDLLNQQLAERQR